MVGCMKERDGGIKFIREREGRERGKGVRERQRERERDTCMYQTERWMLFLSIHERATVSCLQ